MLCHLKGGVFGHGMPLFDFVCISLEIFAAERSFVNENFSLSTEKHSDALLMTFAVAKTEASLRGRSIKLGSCLELFYEKTHVKGKVVPISKFLSSSRSSFSDFDVALNNWFFLFSRFLFPAWEKRRVSRTPSLFLLLCFLSRLVSAEMEKRRRRRDPPGVCRWTELPDWKCKRSTLWSGPPAWIAFWRSARRQFSSRERFTTHRKAWIVKETDLEMANEALRKPITLLLIFRPTSVKLKNIRREESVEIYDPPCCRQVSLWSTANLFANYCGCAQLLGQARSSLLRFRRRTRLRRTFSSLCFWTSDKRKWMRSFDDCLLA